MADQLTMNGLSLNDSKHAGPTMANGRPAYIPPHLRGQPGRSGPPPMDGPATLSPAGDPGLGGSAWGNPRWVHASRDFQICPYTILSSSKLI